MKSIYAIILFGTNAAYAAGSCPSGQKLIAECSLPGKVERKALICYSLEKPTSLTYFFKRKGHVELEVKFSEKNKLKRWTDETTYTRYFGFYRGSYSYTIGVPQETPGALAFLDVKNGDTLLSTTDCLSNSFGEKDVAHPYIENVPDLKVRENHFKFP